MDEYYKYKYYKYKQKYLLMKGGGNGDFTSLPSEMIQQISKFLRPHEKAKLKSTGTQIREDILALDTSKSVYNEYVALLKKKGLENINDNYDQTVDWNKRIEIIKLFGDHNWSKVKEAQTTNVLVLEEIKYLPPEIGNLNNLKFLKMSRVPRFITTESGLMLQLTYEGTQPTIIPPEIRKLSSLETLSLIGIDTEILPEIGELKNLKHLTLNHNNITVIPTVIGNLINLEILNLTDNQIREIPKEIGKLINLKQLYLGKNQISEIPKEIGNLVNLKYLDLSQNKIMIIPPVIENLRNYKLKYIGLK